MPRVLQRDVQNGFAEGLNTSADESQLSDKQVRVAENARLTEYGGITKRQGTQKVFTSVPAVSPVTGGFTWRTPSPPSHLFVSGGHLYSAPDGLLPLTPTDLGAGLDSTSIPSFASFRDLSQDVVYVVDGGQLNKWNGGVFTANVAGSPNVSRIAVHNDRLFGCGDVNNTETLYFSGLSNGDTLGVPGSGGGEAIIRTFAHEPLTTLLSVGQSLLIFHERGVSRFTGWSQDDFNIDSGTRGVTQDVGTIASSSVVAVENVGFFVSDRGVYSITESGVTGISSNIESLLSQTSATNLRLVSAVHNRRAREVWFAIPGLGVMVFNYRLNSWSGPLTGTYATVAPLAMWESGAGATPEVFFGATDGMVRKGDVESVYRDDVLADGTGGTAYTSTVQCHRMFFGDDASEKSLRYIYLLGNLRGSTGTSVTWETGQISQAATVPASGTAAIWGSGILWGAFTYGPGGSVTSRIQASGSGRYNDIRLVDAGTSNPVFSRVEADAFNMGRRY
jgi:hypothetical protein